MYAIRSYYAGVKLMGPDVAIFDRITSYNVCYTKLLRTNVVFSKGNRNDNGGLAYWRNPIYPVYVDNNPANGYYLIGTQDYSHPIALTEHRTNISESLDFMGSAFAEAQLLPFLTIKSQVNYKYGKSFREFYNPKVYTEDGTFNNGAGGIDNWDARITSYNVCYTKLLRCKKLH